MSYVRVSLEWYGKKLITVGLGMNKKGKRKLMEMSFVDNLKKLAMKGKETLVATGRGMWVLRVKQTATIRTQSFRMPSLFKTSDFTTGIRVQMQVRRKGLHRITPTADATLKLGISPNYCQFQNSREKLIERTKTYYAHGYGLLQGKDTN